MKNIAATILLVLLAATVGYGRSQASPLPPDFVFDAHGDMNRYNKLIVPCIEWLQQVPLDEDKKERLRVDHFVLSWLQINPDINISMPEYSFTFHGIQGELLYLFMEGWIKYTLQTGDKTVTECSIAGIKSMLDYYKSGKAVGVGRNDYLENLYVLQETGKIRGLFDTGKQAQNTFIYLGTPAKQDFRHDENYINFSFYCINLLKPRALTYRYRLEGYYDEWIPTTDRSVTFPRLPPGHYTFRVQGSASGSFAHAPEQSFVFTIGKPIWMETWFVVLTIALGASAVYWFIRQREKSMKNIALLKHERIMFEYEHLKSQVNPHFLFNSLNTLANLIEKDPTKAIAYTEDLSGLYQNILTYHDEDFVLLADEFAILDNYLSIQKGRFGDALKLEIAIPTEVMRTKKVVPLALQILIENVIKHNVATAEQPLTIQITATEDEIVIRNPIYPRMSREKGNGVGLANIKRRYELLTNKPVWYGPQGEDYVVKLPLL